MAKIELFSDYSGKYWVRILLPFLDFNTYIREIGDFFVKKLLYMSEKSIQSLRLKKNQALIQFFCFSQKFVTQQSCRELDTERLKKRPTIIVNRF